MSTQSLKGNEGSINRINKKKQQSLESGNCSSNEQYAETTAPYNTEIQASRLLPKPLPAHLKV